MEDRRLNAFEQLCRVASKENWCWRIGCTTCGGQHFRLGFYYVGQGLMPDVATWRQDKKKIPFEGNFPKEVTNKLLSSVCDANLMSIHRWCLFPDWLGYLGLVYHFFGGFGNYFGTAFLMGNVPMMEVTRNIAPQLLEMVEEDSESYSFLSEIIHSDYTLELRVRDFERIEYNFKNILT
tara:strand:- start:1302 stop:1838 length:537 start_codon:yes stop_codon:yes gene_type:complete